MVLPHLFGNKSVERILYFLLINGKCYASKLATHFKSPLTPLQQGLSKLEKIGVLESYSEGKVRHFQFNSNCPFLIELEALLRKTYSLLPADKKKQYYDPGFMLESERIIISQERKKSARDECVGKT